MATSTIKKLGEVNRIISGIIVPNEGIIIQEQYLDIIGNLYILNLRCQLQTPATGRVSIGSISSNYVPDYTIRFPCSCAETYDSLLNYCCNAFVMYNGHVAVDLINTPPIEEINIRCIYTKA